jgi:PTS system mannose-specific IIB component/fructoselysine and glucoselysine-specific PTS system IIB component
LSVILVRVDDRLIHGQVVVGWGQAVCPDRILLADEEIAESEWELELYRAGVPPDFEVEFTTIEEAAQRVDELMRSAMRTLILVADVHALVRLCNDAPQIREVNLGGLHMDGDRVRKLPYLFLSDEEAGQLRELGERGVTITAQDLPTTTRVPLERLL